MAKYCYECWFEKHKKTHQCVDLLYSNRTGVCKNCGRYGSLVIMKHNNFTLALEYFYAAYKDFLFHLEYNKKRKKDWLKKH